MSQTRLSTTDAAIDVRVIPRPERHRLIGTFERLNSGDTLLVINDHDPRLLSYQFDARYARQIRLAVRRARPRCLARPHQPHGLTPQAYPPVDGISFGSA